MTEFFVYLFVGAFFLATMVVGFMAALSIIAGVFALTATIINRD